MDSRYSAFEVGKDSEYSGWYSRGDPMTALTWTLTAFHCIGLCFSIDSRNVCFRIVSRVIQKLCEKICVVYIARVS